MSSAKLNSRLAWNGVTTETVAATALAVGDAIFHGADLAPHRERALDKFPGGRINVVGSPAAPLTQVPWISLGLYAPTDTVKRAVIS